MSTRTLDQQQSKRSALCQRTTLLLMLQRYDDVGKIKQHREQQVLTDLHVVPLPLQDLYSGLIGPLVVCRRSWGR